MVKSIKKVMKYFAYGSNMSQSRMLQRGIKFSSVEKATLYGYEFVINKRSYKDPNVGFANIRIEENSFVEGVLYEVDDITILDKYEGAPNHYDRIIMPLKTENEVVDAFVYIANQKWISEGLKSTLEYKNCILEGKKYLSEDYYNKLNELILVI
jgi:cation transport regulator ChaC